MMTCRELAELLLDYIDGDLPQEYRDIIGQHLRLCPPCLYYLESYQVTIRISKQLPPARRTPRTPGQAQGGHQGNRRKKGECSP